jgi:glucuronate isomerase
VFGIDDAPRPDTADATFDEIGRKLAQRDYRPLALLERFRIEVLATTDPLDDPPTSRPVIPGSDRVLPTFRARPLTRRAVHRSGRRIAATGQPATFAGYLAARARRAHPIGTAPCRPTTVQELFTADLDFAVASPVRAGSAGTADAAQRAVPRAHARPDGAHERRRRLVMTIHPGFCATTAALRRLGPDTGHDILIDGVHPRHPSAAGEVRTRTYVLFTVDETVYSREIAPLPGSTQPLHRCAVVVRRPDAIR